MEHLIQKDFLYEPLWERIHSFEDPSSLVQSLKKHLTED